MIFIVTVLKFRALLVCLIFIFSLLKKSFYFVQINKSKFVELKMIKKKENNNKVNILNHQLIIYEE